MVVKNDDVVVATSGRGFWILDNISALRQITSEITSAPVHLFTPQPAVRGEEDAVAGSAGVPASRDWRTRNGSGSSVAYQNRPGPDGVVRPTLLDGGQNPSAGAILEDFLRQAPSGPLTLSIIDAEGHEVRRFSRSVWQRAALPARAGMNRFVWDVRYAAARTRRQHGAVAVDLVPAIGAADRAAREYTARLTAESRLTRSRSMSAGIRTGTQPRRTFRRNSISPCRSRDKLSLVNDGLRKVHEAQQQLATLPQSKAAGPQVQAITEKLHAIEGELTRLPGKNPMYLPPKALDNKLSALSSVVSGREGRPTKQMYDVFQYLSQRADSVLAELKDIVDRCSKVIN